MTPSLNQLVMLDDTQHSDPNVENEGAVELQWESENDPDNP